MRGRVSSGIITFDPPKIIEIAKGYKNGRPEYRRVASFENLSDRVILSRMTAYVRDRLESVLSDSCYSFRKDNSITHQTAVEHLQRYRARFANGSLFVGDEAALVLAVDLDRLGLGIVDQLILPLGDGHVGDGNGDGAGSYSYHKG